jgi:hypothetical protein
MVEKKQIRIWYQKLYIKLHHFFNIKIHIQIFKLHIQYSKNSPKVIRNHTST